MPFGVQAPIWFWSTWVAPIGTGWRRCGPMRRCWPRRAAPRALVDGRLVGCPAVAPERADLPPTDWITGMLGLVVPFTSRLSLVADRAPAGRTPGGDVICACFGVTRASLRRTIATERLGTTGAVGLTTRAGTNCRSCIPEIAELLRDVHEAA